MRTAAVRDMCFLVVDDRYNMRHMVRGYLRSFGYSNVLEATDGMKALEWLKTGKVDFVICDWMMPYLTGLDLLKKVRADPKMENLPFLMITGEVNEDAVAEAVEEVVDDYLIKPFTASNLREKIEAILNGRMQPSVIDKALAKSEELMAAGQVDTAALILAKALEANPKSPRTLHALGLAHEAKDDLQAAMDCYNRALELSRRFVKAHDSLARVMRKKGQHKFAERHLRQAAKLSPRKAARQVELGRVLLEQGRTQEGLAAMDQARRTGGGDAEVARQVGEALLGAGLNQQAAQAFENALSLDPKMAHVYNRLGIAYRRQGLLDKAIDQYKLALDVSANDENLLYNYAVACWEAGRKTSSRNALQKALAIRPDFKEAKSLLDHLEVRP